MSGDQSPYGVREWVFHMLNELEGMFLLENDPDHPDGGYLQETADAEALAEFLTRYGGGVYDDGEPMPLHGIPEADLIPHCAAWLLIWRARDKVYQIKPRMRV